MLTVPSFAMQGLCALQPRIQAWLGRMGVRRRCWSPPQQGYSRLCHMLPLTLWPDGTLRTSWASASRSLETRRPLCGWTVCCPG